MDMVVSERIDLDFKDFDQVKEVFGIDKDRVINFLFEHKDIFLFKEHVATYPPYRRTHTYMRITK